MPTSRFMRKPFVTASIVLGSLAGCTSARMLSDEAPVEERTPTNEGTAEATGPRCVLPHGTYRIHYENVGGDAGCIPPADQIIEPVDGGVSGLVDGCTTTERREETCTTTSRCVLENEDFSTSLNVTEVISDGGASGTILAETVRSDGAVLADCSYAFTCTKVESSSERATSF